VPPPEIGFYHLQRTALEPALGKLLEKVLASGQRAVVQASSAERVEALSRFLWTADPAGFLPHGSRADGEAERQPIWLTERAEVPNAATVLILVDGAEAEPPPGIARCLYMFDGNDPEAVEQARAQWRAWRERGATVTYWQQAERGWRKAGESG
jgi:DNA polymerase III subunit chi